MSITLVHKSDTKAKAARAAKALVLAGGAVTGGSFMTGGLKALGDYLTGFNVNAFDIYVGISSGSLIAAPLAGGIRPESILRSLDGTSRHFSRLTGWHYYRPNIEELMARPLAFAARLALWVPRAARRMFVQRREWLGMFAEDARAFMAKPSIARYERMVRHVVDCLDGGEFPSIMSLVPTGAFDNRPLERYVRENIERNGLTNSFEDTRALTRRRLYICAIELDGARPVIFGPDERTDLTISEAVMASTALPGFYRPARIRGVDYVDGMVHETANIDLAVTKGAKLIICYNPFRPYEPAHFMDQVLRERDLLSRAGIFAVMYQIVRAALHARLAISIDRYRQDPAFKGDIILIEPCSSDTDFSALNPLLLSNRVRAAWLGYTSVRDSLEQRFDELKDIFKRYGIGMRRPPVGEGRAAVPEFSEDPAGVQEWLEGRMKKQEYSSQ